jgi:hypothetical protein
MPLARASNALCGLRCNGIGHRGECAPKRFGHLHPAAFPKIIARCADRLGEALLV